MGFGDYTDFEDCVSQNQDKDSPEAFCAWLEKQITGHWPSEGSKIRLKTPWTADAIARICPSCAQQLRAKGISAITELDPTQMPADLLEALGRAMQSDAPERRTLALKESRIVVDDSGKKLIGYAAVFNSPSLDLGGFVEVIRPGAFMDSLQRDDWLLLFNHDANYVLGRMSSKTLAVREDEVGLRYEAALPDTSYARDLAEVIKRGDVRGGSFTFWVQNERWTYEGMYSLRELLKVKVEDVSVVTFPAYPATDVVSPRARETAKRLRPQPAPTDRTVLPVGPSARLRLAHMRLELLARGGNGSR